MGSGQSAAQHFGEVKPAAADALARLRPLDAMSLAFLPGLKVSDH